MIHNAIGKKPEKRYQTGKRMAAHLQVCLERLNEESAASPGQDTAESDVEAG